MSAPEYQPQSPQPEQQADVQQVPEQVIPPEVEQATGAQQSPPDPQQQINQALQQQPQPQQQAQPQATQTMSVPAASQQQLDDYAKGDAANSSTWFGVYWVRRAKQALQDGIQVVFGQQNN